MCFTDISTLSYHNVSPKVLWFSIKGIIFKKQ